MDVVVDVVVVGSAVVVALMVVVVVVVGFYITIIIIVVVLSLAFRFYPLNYSVNYFYTLFMITSKGSYHRGERPKSC